MLSTASEYITGNSVTCMPTDIFYYHMTVLSLSRPSTPSSVLQESVIDRCSLEYFVYETGLQSHTPAEVVPANVEGL